MSYSQLKKLTYHSTAERPEATLWIQDDDGTLIDFSSGYTFTFRIGTPGSTAVLDKTSGITGAAGSGDPLDGTPNVTIAWSAGELDIDPGVYKWQLTATTASNDRVFEGIFEILPVIT